MVLDVHQFLCLQDNFCVLIRDEASGACAAVDAPDGEAIVAEAARLGWRLTHLLLTHHHADHTQGVPALRRAFPGIEVVAARSDAHRLPPLDREVSEGDRVAVGSAIARVLEVPGHTRGHIAYYFAEDEIVFVGDTLFSLGCGRLFEGTAEMMSASLEKLAELPDETKVYCGHEYTQANARFALTVDPDNSELRGRAATVDQLRASGRFTLPSTIGLERMTNPFLRTEQTGVQAALGLSGEDKVQVFAAMRARKDNFRG